jgi:hypothetical protein
MRIAAAILAGLHPPEQEFPMPIAAFIPPYAPDAAELLLVLITIFISLGIMVAFGAWWSR